MKKISIALVSIIICFWATAAYYPNTVTSSGNALRVEAALLASGCASITSQTGSWLTSSSSGGTGICNITVTTGIFSSAPFCTCTTVAQRECRLNAATTTTAIVTVAYDGTSAHSPIDTPVYLMCIGSK